MALRGPLFRLLRTQLSQHTCQQSRAHSVAVLGAPFSKGQVGFRLFEFECAVNVQLCQYVYCRGYKAATVLTFLLNCDRKEEAWSMDLKSSEMRG